MFGIYTNPAFDDRQRRDAAFAGNILLYTGVPGLLRLVDHARSMIEEAFAPHEPLTAYTKMTVPEFVKRTSPLKGGFTNGETTKRLMADFIAEFGADPERTYYDLPRLRVNPSGDYLTSGVSYAYAAHRDMWYAHPAAMLNFWLPVYDIGPDCGMSMFPRYWDRPVKNGSAGFDYDDWVVNARPAAVNLTKKDDRPHPLPQEPIDTNGEFRHAGRAGDVMVFSGQHLHGSAPNTSGKIRFSIDFRTLNLDDVLEGRGPKNIDNRSTGTTLGDWLRVSDLQTLDVSKVDVAKAHPKVEDKVAEPA